MRLQRKGRRKRPFYHIVVADGRAPRDGRFIERLGSYNPMTKPATIEIDRDKAFDWLQKGVQPTDTVRAILRFKGVYYKRHLMRGVAKGALTEEQADAKYQEWIDNKEAKIAARFEQSAAEHAQLLSKLSGTPPPPPAPEPEEVAEETAPAEETPEAEAPATETATEEAPAEAETEAPAEEAAAEATPAAEQPAAEEEKKED
ncbi:MAG: 30S ribosomal protein S16 [Phaeodactylibacter sp.]|uniref:30S ribosomal protein S16 n=1 Tax=Phaeodactylibacter sp. TaxID=1940289 RepID=UPI0032ED89E9